MSLLYFIIFFYCLHATHTHTLCFECLQMHTICHRRAFQHQFAKQRIAEEPFDVGVGQFEQRSGLTVQKQMAKLHG